MFSVVLAAAKKLTESGEEARSDLADQIAGAFQFLISRIPAWITGFLVFVLTIFVAKVAKSAVEARIASRVDDEHQDIPVLAGRVTYYGTLIFGTFVALKIAGIDLTAFLAALGLGIGFALRDLIMNFLAGVLILVSRQFTIGDFIKVGQTVGKVMEIQTRATILKAIDGTKVIVPNSEIFTSQVTNFTGNAVRRVTIPLFVSYDTDLSYAMKISLETIKKHPKVQKKPAPSIVVKDYGDSTVDLVARFWVGARDGWYKVKCELLKQLWEDFRAAGVVVPYNMLHLETEQDNAAYVKEAQELEQKRKEEMMTSQAIQEDAKKTPQTAPPGAIAPANGNPVLAAATVPVEPEATYADQNEIDGQG